MEDGEENKPQAVAMQREMAERYKMVLLLREMMEQRQVLLVGSAGGVKCNTGRE